MSGFQSGPPVGGLLHYSHHLQGAALRRLPRSLGGEFGRFLLAWAAVNFGVAPFFAYYPLIMTRSFSIDPTTTAFLYALAAAIGIGLFVLAGRTAQRYGARLVFQLGLALRIAGFGILGVLILVPHPRMPAAAMLGFTFAMLAWPVLSVSGTGLAANLTPIGEGAAMGLLAASNAIATVLGTFLGGPLVDSSGYRVVPLIAIGGLLSASLLMAKGKREIEGGDDGRASATASQIRADRPAALQPLRASGRCALFDHMRHGATGPLCSPETSGRNSRLRK